MASRNFLNDRQEAHLQNARVLLLKAGLAAAAHGDPFHVVDLLRDAERYIGHAWTDEDLNRRWPDVPDPERIPVLDAGAMPELSPQPHPHVVPEVLDAGGVNAIARQQRDDATHDLVEVETGGVSRYRVEFTTHGDRVLLITWQFFGYRTEQHGVVLTREHLERMLAIYPPREDPQLRQLADAIEEIPGEPSQSEGAIEAAVRLLRKAYIEPRYVYIVGVYGERALADPLIKERTAAGQSVGVYCYRVNNPDGIGEVTPPPDIAPTIPNDYAVDHPKAEPPRGDGDGDQ